MMKRKEESQAPSTGNLKPRDGKFLSPFGQFRAQPALRLGNAVVPEGPSADTVSTVLQEFTLLMPAIYQMQVLVGQQKSDVTPEQLLPSFKKLVTNPLYHNPAYMETIINDSKAQRPARPGMIAKAMIQQARRLKKNTVESYIKDGRKRVRLGTNKPKKTDLK